MIKSRRQSTPSSVGSGSHGARSEGRPSPVSLLRKARPQKLTLRPLSLGAEAGGRLQEVFREAEGTSRGTRYTLPRKAVTNT